MAVLKLRDDLAEKVASLAAQSHLPIEQQLDQLVERALSLSPTAIKARREAFERIAAMTPSGVPQTDSVILLREDRDR